MVAAGDQVGNSSLDHAICFPLPAACGERSDCAAIRVRGPSGEPEPSRNAPSFRPFPRKTGRRREFFPLGVAFSTQRLERQPGKLTRPVRRASGAIGMKRILIVAAASLIAASRALAADLPVRTGPVPAYYPVAAVYDWGGGYVGVNAGYAFGQSEWSDPLNPSGNSSSGNFNVKGALAGVTAGVSGQWNAFLLGIEGDFDWQGLQGSSNSSFCTSIFLFAHCRISPGRIELQDRQHLDRNLARAPAMPGIGFCFMAPPALPARMCKSGWTDSRGRPIFKSAGPRVPDWNGRSPTTGPQRSNTFLSTSARRHAITAIVAGMTRRLRWRRSRGRSVRMTLSN